MSLKIGVSGVWKGIDNIHVGVSGAWKQVNVAWIGVGGVWKKLYERWAAALSNVTRSRIVTSPANATATYRVKNDGTCDSTANNTLDEGTWLLAGSVGDYEVRATLNSGSLASGTTGSWLSCSTTREWAVTVTSDLGGTQAANLTIEIRDTATSTVRASCTVSITATVNI